MIEFLFSLVVLAIVTGGALASLRSAQQLSEDSRQRLVAMDVARSVLEKVKNTDINGLGGNLTGNLNVNAMLPGGGIGIRCRSEDVPNPNVANSCAAVAASDDVLATVIIDVYWTAPGSNRANACTLADNAGCRSLRAVTMRSSNFDD